MHITFHGGARTVTGSRHLLSVNGHQILLECGMYQGRRKESYKRNKGFDFDPAQIDAMLLSHAHIDHSGNIPNLVKNGFTGPIYTTRATVDLCKIMLRDSAHIQEKDAEWINKKKLKKGQPLVEPIYNMDDAEASLSHFQGVSYDETFDVVPGVKATYRDAGHILGSAGIELDLEEEGRKIRLGFSGDVGRTDMPLIHDPNFLRDLDALIMESTYGNRFHAPRTDVEEELAQTVRETVEAGGKIIIPAFAVGRTQLLVYMLHKLFNENRIPDIPIYVDSPLASKATEVFRHHPECYDRETGRVFLESEEDPLGFRRLRFTRDVEESKQLNMMDQPHIIISASGMAEAGRILHHLRNNIQNPNNLVLFVGYAASHTLARKMMDGAETVRIFGEEHTVSCRVKIMDYFSAHSDQNELVDYLSLLPPERLKKIILVHGDEDQAPALMERLKGMGYGEVLFPGMGERVVL